MTNIQREVPVFAVQVIHTIFGFLYALTGNSRYMLMKIVRLMNAMCITRLMWMMSVDRSVGALVKWSRVHRLRVCAVARSVEQR